MPAILFTIENLVLIFCLYYRVHFIYYQIEKITPFRDKKNKQAIGLHI